MIEAAALRELREVSASSSPSFACRRRRRRDASLTASASASDYRDFDCRAAVKMHISRCHFSSPMISLLNYGHMSMALAARTILDDAAPPPSAHATIDYRDDIPHLRGASPPLRSYAPHLPSMTPGFITSFSDIFASASLVFCQDVKYCNNIA